MDTVTLPADALRSNARKENRSSFRWRKLVGRAVMVAFAGSSLAASADCGGLVLHAHRGPPSHPENSLSGVKAALQGAWDGVEIDLQQLVDRTPVLNHDPFLGRTTSVRGPQSHNLDATAWREIRLKNRNGDLTREAPAFLAEVLEAMKDSPKLLNAEIKQVSARCNFAERIVQLMHEGRPGGQWFLTSIDRSQLKCVRQYDPEGYLGLIVLDYQSAALQDKRSRTPLRVPQPQIDAVWLDYLLKDVTPPLGLHLDVHTLESNPSLLQMARERKMPVFTYSLVDDKRHVSVLRKVAAKTQLWPTGAIIDGDPDAFCKAIR